MNKSTTTVSYACPLCHRSTNEATTTDDYTPTTADRAFRPEIGAKQATQHLHCPCGKVYTWFSAMQVTERDRT